MNIVEGFIVDIVNESIRKGRVSYTNKIESITYDESIESGIYILPGFVDAHVHIESTMLSPLEYSKIALSHGVIAAVTDPHEIANVCGINGVNYMYENAKETPMKLFFGAPSCVPATPFETSGNTLSAEDINQLFAGKKCTHLSEMMNYPGVINEDPEVVKKIHIAQQYGLPVDGHAPLLTGKELRKYVGQGILTDHECTTVHEALEKISLGMKIMIRNGSAAKDFVKLKSLIKTHSEHVMLCTDDCHPDELRSVYINGMVKDAIMEGMPLFDVLNAAIKTARDFYKLPIGLLQENDPADFILIDDLQNFAIKATIIGGETVFSSESGVTFSDNNNRVINNFYKNDIDLEQLAVTKISDKLNVIEIIPDSLLTKKKVVDISDKPRILDAFPEKDVLKMVVLNRYSIAKPAIGFVNGFNLKRGAIAGSIAHDSHNIVAVGVDDESILKAIEKIQQYKGGLVVVDHDDFEILPLPIAGLMSDKTCSEVADTYERLSTRVRAMGSLLKAPFMTLAFMSLLVIPEIKLGDRGLFDVNSFEFIGLQE